MNTPQELAKTVTDAHRQSNAECLAHAIAAVAGYLKNTTAVALMIIEQQKRKEWSRLRRGSRGKRIHLYRAC